VAGLSEVQREGGLAAPRVEDLAVNHFLVNERGKVRLGSTYAPGRFFGRPQWPVAAVGGIEI
jgi:hypothetical protein